MTDKTIAVILARAGSKGLANKNALPVAGKPMLAWTIEHALASKRIDRVLVTTDGEELASIATGLGVDVVLRPPELANDTATVDAAARHAVNEVVGMHEQVCLLYGNIPVRPDDLADRALARLEETHADSVQSVCSVEKNHPYWMKTVDTQTGVLGMFIENDIYRRQDLPPLYMLDGGVIALQRASLFRIVEGEPHAFLGQDRRSIITKPGDVVDVDSVWDLRLAEAILSKRMKDPAVRAAG